MTGAIALTGMLALRLGAGAPPLFGVALLSDDQPCVALQEPVAPGTSVTLVSVEEAQQAYRATLGQPLAACDAIQAGSVSGPYYELSDVDPPYEGPVVAIAVFGVSQVRSSGGLVQVTVEALSETIAFRSCTSYEGLHLTAWAGQPLSGQRLWHAYWYLGYNVEPSCQDAEVESAPSASERPANEELQLTKPAILSVCAGFAAELRCWADLNA